MEGTGSVWNTGSYHWEEKSVNKWAEDTMRSTLSNFNYRWNDALLRISEVKEMKGESGVSIRKGKKIVSYDYAITLKWACAMMAMEGDKEVASCEGTFEMPEISNEEAVDDWEIRVSYTKDTDNLKAILGQMISGMATKELRKEIKEKFVDELVKK